MALADIIKKIDIDAAAAAATILAAAEAEAATTVATAKADAAAMTETGMSDAERTESKVKERAIAAAHHEAKFALQSLKVETIDSVFKAVEQQLNTMTDDAYEVFVTTRAAALKGEDGTITVDSSREGATVTILKKAGIAASSVITAPIGGGFILETATARFDHSFTTVLTRTRELLASEVASALFATK
jgi:vacuolar-type H+-ATPase subunit E/Vma4